MAHQGTRIGWIGFGSMGQPMCANLSKAGFQLFVYDKDRSKIRAIEALGATPASSPAEVAEKCDIVFSIIWDDNILRDVALGEGGVLAAARPELTYVDMSTVSINVSAEVAKALEEKGASFLRATVSGSAPVAKAGELSVYASGPRSAYELCLPMFQAMCAKQMYVGTKEEARIVKLAINMLVNTTAAALGEALTFGEKAGVDRSLLMDAINESIVGSPHFKVRAETIKRRDLTSQGSAAGTKDLGLALQIASEVGAALPITALVRQYLTVIMASGEPLNGVVALVTFLDRIKPASVSNEDP